MTREEYETLKKDIEAWWGAYTATCQPHERRQARKENTVMTLLDALTEKWKEEVNK